MNNFFEDLKTYFEVTPREKVLEDWAKSEEFDKVGLTVEDFLQNTQHYYVFSDDPLIGSSINSKDYYSPKFTSGFFIFKNITTNGKSNIFNYQL
jgi:hypothetical protein